MLQSKLIVTCAALALSGCASSWIENPSPATRNLVNDLKLEGFKCKAGFSDIVCDQIDPLHSKQPAKCTSEKGCVEQPDKLVRNRYVIKQLATGIPSIKHEIVEQIEGQILGGESVRQD